LPQEILNHVNYVACAFQMVTPLPATANSSPGYVPGGPGLLALLTVAQFVEAESIIQVV